jgi:hypothetical protein
MKNGSTASSGPPGELHEPAMNDDYLQATRIVKKLRPGQPGTRRVMKRYGDGLVCVRYRHDRLGLYRVTTIELVIDAGPIHPRRFDAASFGVHLERHEHALRAALRAHGARWDPMDRLWWARGATLRKLELVDRIQTR